MIKILLGIALLFLLYQTPIGGQFISLLVALAVLSLALGKWDTIDSELQHVFKGEPSS